MNQFDRFSQIIDDMESQLCVFWKRQADSKAFHHRLGINSNLVTVRKETTGTNAILKVRLQPRQSEFGGAAIGCDRHLMRGDDGILLDDFQHSVCKVTCCRGNSNIAAFPNNRVAGNDRRTQVRQHSRTPGIHHVFQRRNQIGCPDPHRQDKCGKANGCDDGPAENFLPSKIFLLASGDITLSLLSNSLDERVLCCIRSCSQLQRRCEAFLNRWPLLFQCPRHGQAVAFLLEWHHEKPSSDRRNDPDERQPESAP